MDSLRELLKQQGYDNADTELILYGYKKLFLFSVNVILTVLVGYLRGCGVGMILFLLFYIPLRIYAGGFHMNKLWKCEVMTFGVILMVSLLLKVNYCQVILSRLTPICVLSCILIHFVLAPQDTEKKRLYNRERVKYRIIVIFIVMIYAAAYFVFEFYRDVQSIKIPLVVALVVSAASLMENYFYEKIK